VDVVLLDILMPGMDGLQVLGRIREAPATRHLPVIMLSAVDNEAVVVRCIELGADDFVPKPFDPTFLRARVGACLEKKRLRDAEDAARADAERQRRRVEELLAVMFPREVLPELTQRGEVAPRRYEGVAVLFCDVVDFTRWCDGQEPEVVVSHLQRLVTIQEDLAERHGLQKVKTIGDAFMAAAGVFRHTRTPVLDCVRWGLDAIAAAREATGWELRVGVHVGPVVGGIVGRTQSLFDLWGDTVNTAARMEAHGVAGAVCLTREAWASLDGACEGDELEAVDVKGKGRLERWRVAGERSG
jgi:class 3 adenylate cyclase